MAPPDNVKSMPFRIRMPLRNSVKLVVGAGEFASAKAALTPFVVPDGASESTKTAVLPLALNELTVAVNPATEPFRLVTEVPRPPTVVDNPLIVVA
jgi:hypothetical protein